MALEISGTVLQVLPEQTGTGRNGQWVKQEFILETQDQFPRKICFSAWGEKAASVKNLKPGALINVSFNAESREFNGRWYTDLRIWKIEETQASSQTTVSPEMLEPLSPGENQPDDLPF